MNLRRAVRTSFFAKIAVWLVAGSRDMAIYPDLPLSVDGRFSITRFDTVYSVMPKLETEELDVPGINIVLIDEIDIAPDRLTSKRFTVPVVFEIVRPLMPGDAPYGVAQDVWEIAYEIDTILRDGFFDIWDYSLDPPAFTGKRAHWIGRNISWGDESLASEGGDIRLVLNFSFEFVEAPL